MRVLTRCSAALLLSLIRPGTDTGLLVVNQAIRAGDHVELAVHAIVELATLLGILMREVAVPARAVQGWDWSLCKV